MKDKTKYIFAGIAFAILTVIGYFMMPKTEETLESKAEESNDIYVHIDGQIKEPGLKKVKYGTRLYELIEEAGGETEEADLSRINLATVLTDEQKVVIPAKITVSDDTSSETKSGLVNINTASKEKLMKLNGIGEGMAERIIKYRQDNGYFNSIDDLKNVSGIGESKFNGLKDEITI